MDWSRNQSLNGKTVQGKQNTAELVNYIELRMRSATKPAVFLIEGIRGSAVSLRMRHYAVYISSTPNMNYDS